jgi:hypothetical protein
MQARFCGQADRLRLVNLRGKDGWQLHLVLKPQRIDNRFAPQLRHRQWGGMG